MTSPVHLATTPPVQNATTASPWVPLWQIIEQIASAIGDNREAEHYAKTRQYIRQVAAEGRLRIRGRHEIEVAGQERTNFSEIYTEISPAYWKYSVINVLATGAAFEADRHTNPEKTPYAWGPKGLYEPNCYTGLQLNSDDVSQLIGDVRGTGLLAADARAFSTETEPLKFSDIVILKLTLWGMSIDLLKAWKWLREGSHSLHRKQHAMPQFLKTASILNRLWRDPVWSIVIATGITTGIGALVLYFHTQNPLPPATTPPPAIPVAPPVLTQQSPQSPPTANHQGPTALPNPKSINVERWMPVSNDASIKATIPAAIFEDWETQKHTADELTQPDAKRRLAPPEMLQDVEAKKHTVDDLTEQLHELAAQQLDYGAKPPSPSADIGGLKLKVQRAQYELQKAEDRLNEYIDPKVEKAISERNAAEARVKQYLLERLATGKLIARGIPNDALPHDNEQVIIKPAQWQYLRLNIATGDAAYGGTTVFKGVEIGKPRTLFP